MRYVSFSLKTIFIATAAIAFFGYRVFPFPIEIHCDRMGVHELAKLTFWDATRIRNSKPF